MRRMKYYALLAVCSGAVSACSQEFGTDHDSGEGVENAPAAPASKTSDLAEVPEEESPASANTLADPGIRSAIDLKDARISGKPHTYRRFDLAEGFEGLVRGAPRRGAKASPVSIELPMPEGDVTQVQVLEDPILSPALQAAHPELRNYFLTGDGVQGRLSWTPQGFSGILLTKDGTVGIGPADANVVDALQVEPGGGDYVTFWARNVVTTLNPDELCHAHDNSLLGLGSAGSAAAVAKFTANDPSGSQLATYRLAVNTTGEYVQTGAIGGTAANALIAINNTITNVNAVYQAEVAVAFQIVDTNIFTDPATDPFTGTNVGALYIENQTYMDGGFAGFDPGITTADYDIAHIFSGNAGGGIANIGVTCNDSLKARGATGLSNPTGFVFDIEFVGHEIGHQMGANHTWNGNASACSNDQWAPNSAYEPGSGSTIMGYAGGGQICTAAQTVQTFKDPVFHSRSFEEITTLRDTTTCGTDTATGNAPPTVEAGPGCVVPQSTPFTLTAEGQDDDGHPLTFSWEQYDVGNDDFSGNTDRGVPVSTNNTGPMFRSRLPTSSPSRTFPRFQDILNPPATSWEVLPSVARTLDFRVTARDNQVTGGVDYDTTSVVVYGAPFAVTAPSPTAALECGTTDTVTWQVGGSLEPNVEIRLSTDGGTTFTTIVPTTANDGSADIAVPATLTNAGRILLQPLNQCYFAVSQAFQIDDTIPPEFVDDELDEIQVTRCDFGEQSVTLEAPAATDLCDSDVLVEGTITASSNPAVPVGTTFEGGTAITLPAGSYTVEWTAIDEAGNTSTTSLEQSVQILPGIQASDSIIIRENSSRVLLPGGQFASIANSGNGITDIKNDARVGDVLSVANVAIGHRAIVGNVVSQDNIAWDHSAALPDRPVIESETIGPVSLPAPLDLSGITFPTTPGSQAINTATVPPFVPGNYGQITVNTNGVLVLQAGTYFFEALTVNSGGKIVATPDTVLFVKNSNQFQGPIVDSSNNLVPVFLGYNGTTLNLSNNFMGTVVAPNATVKFGTSSAQLFIGTIHAKTIDLQNGADLQCQAAPCPESICGQPPAPSCDDGIENGDEEGVDCGGSCPDACQVACNEATYQAETMFHSTGGSTPGGWNIWDNGYISTNHDFTAGTAQITVSARGQSALGVLPNMRLSVGGTVVANQSVLATPGYQPYVFTVPVTAGSKEVRVAFTNDFYSPPQDRNLFVDSVNITCD